MSIPESVVVDVLVRSARHCCICRRFSPLQIQIHHIVERSNGGTDDEENLIPICINCHSLVHVKTQMTKGFGPDELKGHRDEVYDMVAKGKLPAQPQITGGEVHAISAAIIGTLNAENKSRDISDRATEILLAAACEEAPIEVVNNEHGSYVRIGGQIFFFSESDGKQYPDEFFELAKKGYLSLNGNLARLTESGVFHVQELVKTTAKFVEKKVKCLCCSLHFTIHSWNPDGHRAKDLHCPECGQSDGAFIVWSQWKFGFIFQQVPGNSVQWDVGKV